MATQAHTEAALTLALDSAHSRAVAKLRAECTEEVTERVYRLIGKGVRVTSPNIRRVGLSELDLFRMEAAGLARYVSDFALGDRVTVTWIVYA